MRAFGKYLALFIIFTSVYGRAQDEFAPQEAPFVQEENEFEEAPEAVNLNDQVEIPESPEEDIFPEEEPLKTVEEPAVVPAEPEVQRAEVARPPSSSVMQRSKKGGTEYIEHPQAAKGLIAITKDGSYIYKTNDSNKFDNTGSFRFGMMDPPKIVSANNTSFESIYTEGQQPILMFDYEWQPFTKYGKLGVQLGLGVMVANGTGIFLTPPSDPDQQTPKEKYTFVAVPINAGVVYRLEWMSRQWVAPYIAGGGTYVAVAEFRDDGKSPSGVGTPGAYGAGGLLFNITAMNRETAFTIRSEYGISNLWVSVDFRYLKTFNEDLDFNSSIIGAGITADY